MSNGASIVARLISKMDEMTTKGMILKIQEMSRSKDQTTISEKRTKKTPNIRDIVDSTKRNNLRIKGF